MRLCMNVHVCIYFAFVLYTIPEGNKQIIKSGIHAVVAVAVASVNTYAAACVSRTETGII